MATIQENLNTLNDIKNSIKTSINNKGVDAGDDITLYGDKIREISGGEEVDYLCFEALEDSTISLTNFGDNAPNIEYSFDKKNWTTWDYSAINLSTGMKVYMRGDNPDRLSGNVDNGRYSMFTILGNTKLCGKASTLIDYNTDILDLSTHEAGTYELLFSASNGNTCNISDASELVIDNYSSLSERCFCSMFGRNTFLKKAPKLPLITSWMCCWHMFRGTSVEEYNYTLSNNLTYGCYYGLFNGCSKLKIGPYLPAKTLVDNCYSYMFQNCSSLQYIKAEFTTTPTTTYALNWVNGVASTGCLIKANDATWTTKGTYACPSGWTLITSVS